MSHKAQLPSLLSMLRMDCTENAFVMRKGCVELSWQCSSKNCYSKEKNQQNHAWQCSSIIICCGISIKSFFTLIFFNKIIFYINLKKKNVQSLIKISKI